MEKLRYAIVETIDLSSGKQMALVAQMCTEAPILIIVNEPIPIKPRPIINVIEVHQIPQPTKRQSKNFNKQQIKKGWKRK